MGHKPPKLSAPSTGGFDQGRTLGWIGSSPLSTKFSIMAASASQTRVKEEVERSIEKLEKEKLRGLQVSY